MENPISHEVAVSIIESKKLQILMIESEIRMLESFLSSG